MAGIFEKKNTHTKKNNIFLTLDQMETPLKIRCWDLW